MCGNLTIPDALYQAFLTILGAVIGAFIADRIARRGERRRAYESARDRVIFVIDSLLFDIERQTGLHQLWKSTFRGVGDAVFRFRATLPNTERIAVSEAWGRYADIKKKQLSYEKIPAKEGIGSTLIDYSRARMTMSEPLRAIRSHAK